MAAGEGARQFFTFVILYNVLIPISLYVSVEVVKLAQVYLLHWDLEMFDPVHQDHARARTSNLNEELGQVRSAVLVGRDGERVVGLVGGFPICLGEGLRVHTHARTYTHTDICSTEFRSG